MKFSLASTVAIAFFAHQALAGPIEGCLQTHTVVAGDSCVGIATAFKLTPDQFYAMNPKLHHLGDHICDNLDDGKPYCVCTKKPCVAESSAPSGNTTVGGTTTGAATTGAATTTGAVTTGAASTPVAPKSGTSTSGSASGTAPSPSTSPSAGNSLIVPTTMLGLVSVAVAILL